MERNRNIDIIRAAALLLVLIYHCWVRLNKAAIPMKIVENIVALGGETGVTAFFLLSGYGIYCSLYRMEEKGQLQFWPFMKKRVQRIVPQYYLNLMVALLFTHSAVYWNKIHIWTIISHFLFLHNFRLGSAGAINGVLWTMAVIFQFYLLAIPLYKILNKTGYAGIALSIGITILSKMICYYIIKTNFQNQDNDMAYYFWLGRNMLSSVLDNFVIGMGVAFFVIKKKHRIKQIHGIMGCIIFGIVFCVLCKIGRDYEIHTSYLWYSCTAICIGAVMLFSCYIKCEHKNVFSKCMLYLSKYEYGIYLWHLLMIDNLIRNAPVVSEWTEKKEYFPIGAVFVILSVGAGVVFTRLTDRKYGIGQKRSEYVKK